MGEARAGRRSRFHTVRLIGLTSIEALCRRATITNSSSNHSRLKRVDLCVLLGGQLVSDGGNASLALVAIKSERVLTVHLAREALA